MQQPEEFLTEGLLTINELRELRDHHSSSTTTDYIEHEIEIREKLFATLTSDKEITSILFSCPWTATYCEYDCFIISASTPYFVEAKERSYRSTAFDEWFIDEDKLRRLRRLEHNTSITALWAAIFPDDVTMIWPIAAHVRREEVDCHWKTFEKDLGTTMKMMLFYPSNTAIVL